MSTVYIRFGIKTVSVPLHCHTFHVIDERFHGRLIAECGIELTTVSCPTSDKQKVCVECLRRVVSKAEA